MKYIAKMMLALLASVTLVIPAYAWDFSASGSVSSAFNMTTTKASKDADALSSQEISSEGDLEGFYLYYQINLVE